MEIILYLDQGTSLSLYESIGTLDREMAVYRKLVDLGYSVTILSWAKGEDDSLVDQVAPIQVIQNKSGLPNRIWMLRQLFKLRHKNKNEYMVLTNQLFGGYLAAFVKLFLRYNLIVRFGYLTSANFEQSDGKNSKNHIKSLINEFFSLFIADQLITTSDRISHILSKRIPTVRSKIHVVPNYVDESLFFLSTMVNKASKRDIFRVISTGRLSKEKRYPLLIEALSRLSNVELHIVGSGPDQEALEKQALACGVSVKFLGMVRNNELPDLYRSSDLFALCSEYEGHPKALIEAMACGMPVVATDVRGIQDVIENDKTGKLVEANVDAIAKELRSLQNNALLCDGIGAAAALFAEKYSLKKYTESIDKILTARSL